MPLMRQYLHTMDQLYYVTSRVIPATCKLIPFHAFSDRMLAERFCELQDIRLTGILEVYGPQGLGDEVDILVKDNSVVRVQERSTGNGTRGRLDPFVAEHAAGLVLWHVELTDEGTLVKCVKSFSTVTCSTLHLPLRTQMSRYNWPRQRPNRFVVHCFAQDHASASALALKVQATCNESFGSTLPEGVTRLSQTPSLVRLLSENTH